MKKKKTKKKILYKTINKKKDEKENFYFKKFNEMKNAIKKNTYKVPLYNIFFDECIKDNINSFCDLNTYNVDKCDINEYKFINDLKEKNNNFKNKNIKLSCNKIIILPNDKQKELLLSMFEGYRKAYNITLHFIKSREYIKKHSNILESEKNVDIKQKKLKKTKEEKQKERSEKVDKYKNNNDLIIDFDIIRTYFIKDKLKYLSKKYKTPSHSLAYAVKLACTSYKSALTNLKNGNIKYFNIRYLKTNKKSCIMDIEKTAFSKKSFFTTILGNVMNTKVLYNGSLFDFKSIKHDCKLHYNKNSKIFTLLVPNEYIEPIDNKFKIYNELKNNELKNNLKYRKINEPKKKLFIEKKEYISIDCGIKNFLNCFSNNKYIEIGSNIRNTYIKMFNKIDNIDKMLKDKSKNINFKYTKKNNKIYTKLNNINKNQLLNNLDKDKRINTLIKNLKQKLQNKIYNKVKNITTDIHWKIILYLTKHYKHITIGNWSTKSIISNEKSVLNSYNKRFAQNISFYKFLQRLQFKCAVRNISLRIQDEYYTSKVCTNCTYKHEKLGGNDMFNCPSCNIKIKRDYNGARNIMLKSLL